MNAAEKKRKNRFKMRMIKVGVVLACLVVLVLLGLLIRWIVLSIQGNTNKLDKASISAYEKINKSIVQITEDSSYIEMSISDRKEIIIEELERLEREGAVNSDSIVYQQDNEMIWYKWGDGYVAGIMLSEFGEDLSGNADKNEFVTELASDFPGWKNLTSPDQWKSEINFSNASYPFSESDLINLNLKAKYMFGICDANDTTSGYYKYLIAYRGNMQSWNKSHLSTEIDEYCTVDDFKSGLSGYNLVIIEEHGNYDYAKTPMICTEESVGNIAQYSDMSEHCSALGNRWNGLKAKTNNGVIGPGEKKLRLKTRPKQVQSKDMLLLFSSKLLATESISLRNNLTGEFLAINSNLQIRAIPRKKIINRQEKDVRTISVHLQQLKKVSLTWRIFLMNSCCTITIIMTKANLGNDIEWRREDDYVLCWHNHRTNY